jgi:hypothetical protein
VARDAGGKAEFETGVVEVCANDEPFSFREKLRVQFRKALRKGHVINASLDPVASKSVVLAAEPDEGFVVRIDQPHGGSYWFSDRRLLHEDESGSHEVLRYDAVRNAYWMFRDLPRRLLMSPSPKRDHYDRLEIETKDGLAVLEGLGQAYWPALHFFWWITRRKTRQIAQEVKEQTDQ